MNARCNNDTCEHAICLNDDLPPLPPVDGYDVRVNGHYSAQQMREYALLAIERYREVIE